MLPKRSPWLLLAPVAAAVVGLGWLGDFLNPAAHASGYGPLAPPARALGEPFALVELFTSEGCSSCPPADELLAELGTEAQASGERVFPLSFHVDYWDRLGWPDPFASAEWTQRQRAHAAPSGRLYTPQAVTNGGADVVGSKERALRAEVQAALTRAATASRTAHSGTAAAWGSGASRRLDQGGDEPGGLGARGARLRRVGRSGGRGLVGAAVP